MHDDELFERVDAYGDGRPRRGTHIDVDILHAQMIVAAESGDIDVIESGAQWDRR